MRRFATIAASLGLMLGLSAVGQLFAQDPKKDEAKKPEAPKVEAKKEEPKKEAAPAKPAEAPIPAIPPEVEAKLEAARKAVAEAIVAAQDAGLVESTIEPPPILDILVTGRALDARDVKARRGVSVEVFGGWFTAYNKAVDGVTAQENIRIMKPSQGLTEFYNQRANVFNRHIEAARKAKAAAPKPEAKKEEPKKEEPKKEEKKPEAKKEEPKKEEVKKEEPKKAEAKKEEPKKDEAKKPEAKKEEPKKDAPKSK